MGKRRSWVSAVKRALTSQSNKDKKKNKDKKSNKPKRRWFRKRKRSPKGSPPAAETELVVASTPPSPVRVVEARDIENDEQISHAQSIVLATAAAAEAAVAAVQAAAEVVRLTTAACSPVRSKSKEEVAAIRIQTAFRGYLARRALSALRGLARLKSRVQGNSAKQQATSTLRCMQTLARLQSQIRTRRITMSEENRALERHLQQKCEKELEKLRLSVEEDWNDSIHSREQFEAKILNKQDAAMRRERALAYAHSRQILKNPSKSGNPTFLDPNNPHWGWSWLERWMAARPWENSSVANGDLHSDHGSMRSATSNAISVGELSKSSSCRNTNKPSHTTTRQRLSRVSPSTPPSKARSVAAKASPMSHHGAGGDDDARSMHSFRSEQYQRHSNAGSSVRDDESLTGSPSVPSYMAATESARAKSRMSMSPLGNGSPARGSVSSVKKRASRPSSPAGTRRSGLSKVDIASMKDINAH